jgi:hypothetical protein
MEYRFFIIVQGYDPKIYKVPVCQTARLINEYPDQKFQIYETLQDAKQAALVIVSRAPAKPKCSIAQLPGQPANEDEDLRTTTQKLTEDSVERFHL